MVAQAPGEMDLLLNSINTMMVQLHTMTDAGLTFGENIAATVKKISIQANQSYPVSIQHTLRTQPQGVFVVKSTDTTNTNTATPGGTKTVASATESPGGIDWTTSGQNQVQIKSLPGLDPKKSYDVTLVII